MKLNIGKLCLLFTGAFIFFLISCASKPHFEGQGDLCGIIIDENNKPVKDFIVYCKASDKKVSAKNPGPVKTNESGLFVIYGVPSGDYLLSGSKNNYLSIDPVLYSFEDRTRIICLQTRSYKSAILRAEELIGMGQIKEAESLIAKINCEKDSREELYIKFYQFLLSEDKDNRVSIFKNLRKSNFPNDSFFMDFTNKLEEMLK